MSQIETPASEPSPEERRARLAELLRRRASAGSHAEPTSYGERALWFEHQLAPHSPAYHVAFTARVRSELDVAALRRAVQRLLDRHPLARAAYPEQMGEPVRMIPATREVAFEEADAASLTDEALRRAVEEAYARPFDVRQGPLLRVTLFRRSATDHVLLLTLHHIAFDGWSLGLLLEELRVLYPSERAGTAASLPAPATTYGDYVKWQQAMVRSPEGERMAAYWRRQLAGELAPLELPADRPRPPVQRHRGAIHTFAIGADVSRGVDELAKRAGATVFATLLAAFQVLLHRYTGQQDVLVGSPVTGRPRAEHFSVVGHFVNMVVFRGDLSGNPRFSDFLARLRQTVLAGIEHQDYPFALVVERLQPTRDLSRSPVFQVAFTFHKSQRTGELQELLVAGRSGAPVEWGGLLLDAFPIAQQLGQFDMTLELSDVDGRLFGALKYDADLFEAATVARMAGHLERLLDAFVREPERRVGEVPLVTDAERRALLARDAGGLPVAVDRCLHELFEAQAARTPEAVALSCEGAHITYRELNARANGLAHALRRRGVAADTLVGVYLERGFDMVVALLAVLKAGGAYVPIDPAYPRERVAFMLEDARVPVVVAQRSTAPALPSPAGAAVLCVDGEPAPGEGGARADDLPPVARPDSLAYVIYTSGSTGRPKGVLVTHANVVRLFRATRSWFDFDADDVWTMFHSYAFDFSVWEMWGALLHGGRLVIIPKLVSRSPAAFYDLLADERVTVLNQTPTAFRQLVHVEASRAKTRELNLRLVIFGGEALELGSLRPWVERHGDQRPRLVNMYGITETTVHVTYRPLAAADVAGAAGSVIGGPIPDLQVHLLDGARQLVPIGVPGEIYVGGAGVARGYLNRPELTAERFVPDPFSGVPGARLYRSGDLACRLPNGDIKYLGRIDHQVKIRGFRIEPGEIEAVLGQHPSVSEATVLLREDRPDDQRLVAYVVSRPPATLAGAELRAFLRERLPEYMVPAAFVALDRLPVTSNGKVDRRALPAPAADAAGGRPSVPPRDALELQLTKIWEKVLQVRPIGVEDNFFDLGGHSMLAVKLFAEIDRVTGKALSLATLFQAPTVRELAEIVRQERWAPPWSSLVPIQPGGSRPPFFCVHAHGGHVLCFRDLARRFHADQPFYALQARGLTRGQEPPSRIEDMAAHYIAEIRGLQPEGPYFIGGYCFGGAVAFEMAQQLHAMGQRVGLVALLDTYSPAYIRSPLAKASWGLVGRAVRRLDFELGNLALLEGRARLVYIGEKLRRIAARTMIRIDHLRGRERPLDRVHEAHHQAILRYVPRPYPGPIVLFRASKQPAPLQNDPYLGWGEVAAGGVTVCEVPGYQESIIEEPRVRVLAEQLLACLHDAQTR